MSYFDADAHIGRNVMRRVKVVKVEDDGEIQKVTVQGLADEEFELPLRGQPFGLTTVPPEGSVGYLFSASGRLDQAFLMGLEHPEHRVKERKDGETVMYAKEKQKILMDEDGNIIIKTPKDEAVVHFNPPDQDEQQ